MDHVVITLLSHHDEKEDAKDYIEEQTCSEWQNGFLLADGMKFAFF